MYLESRAAARIRLADRCTIFVAALSVILSFLWLGSYFSAVLALFCCTSVFSALHRPFYVLCRRFYVLLQLFMSFIGSFRFFFSFLTPFPSSFVFLFSPITLFLQFFYVLPECSFFLFLNGCVFTCNEFRRFR